MTCDYCNQRAQYRAHSATTALAATRIACREHVDRARTDCAVVCPPTIVELDKATR